jgi:hypothetical protein
MFFPSVHVGLNFHFHLLSVKPNHSKPACLVLLNNAYDANQAGVRAILC